MEDSNRILKTKVLLLENSSNNIDEAKQAFNTGSTTLLQHTCNCNNATLGIYEQRLRQLELENNHITNLPECDRSVHKYSQRIYEHTEEYVRCY
jgi:hypothetical protein